MNETIKLIFNLKGLFNFLVLNWESQEIEELMDFTSTWIRFSFSFNRLADDQKKSQES